MNSETKHSKTNISSVLEQNTKPSINHLNGAQGGLEPPRLSALDPWSARLPIPPPEHTYICIQRKIIYNRKHYMNEKGVQIESLKNFSFTPKWENEKNERQNFKPKTRSNKTK